MSETKQKSQKKFCSGNLDGINYLEDLSTRKRIILKCILKKWNMQVQAGFVWLMIGADGVPF
jgi:hypothetical protein